jgi:hypothetical protein
MTLLAFHSTSSAIAAARGQADWRLIFGHVEAFWYQPNGIWVFFDPQGRRSAIEAIPDGEEAELRIAMIYRDCETILRAPHSDREIAIPLHVTMTCASQCAALVGLRAYTPLGLHRKLLAHGAEIIHAAEESPRHKCHGRGNRGGARIGGRGTHPRSPTASG